MVDIRDKILERFEVRLCIEAVRRLLHALGFSHISPRPIHPRAKPEKQEEFRNHFSALVMDKVAGNTEPDDIEIWFQDEARAGQKGMLSRVWAIKGERPRIVKDHRYGYAWLFAAACPATAAAVGHVCDRANTDEMNIHLADISAAVTPGHHAVVILDGAGWHRSNDLKVPTNLSLLPLPPYSPELNPMENVFAFLKSNDLANQVFKTVNNVRSAITKAWERFVEDPIRLVSITKREWATCAG